MIKQKAETTYFYRLFYILFYFFVFSCLAYPVCYFQYESEDAEGNPKLSIMTDTEIPGGINFLIVVDPQKVMISGGSFADLNIDPDLNGWSIQENAADNGFPVPDGKDGLAFKMLTHEGSLPAGKLVHSIQITWLDGEPSKVELWQLTETYTLAEPTAQAVYNPLLVRYFYDNMESGPGNWTAQSPWGIIAPAVSGRSSCWHDSPGSNYSNNINISLTLNSPLDLTGCNDAQLKFWTKYQTESCCDSLYIEVSENGGSTWSSLGRMAGSQTSWLERTYSLSGYAGKVIQLRFRFYTDGSVTADGCYIDDVEVLVNYADPLMVAPTASLVSSGPVGGPFNPNSITYTLSNTSSSSISWTASGTKNWVTVTPAAGILPPAGTNTVTVSLNTNANSLPLGVYEDLITITNTGTGVAFQRQIRLGVGTKRILAYVQYADRSQEYPNTIAAIQSVGTNYIVDELNDHTQLNSIINQYNILLIPEMENGTPSILNAIGVQWANALLAFVSNGGVIVACDIEKYQILTGAGLLTISSYSTSQTNLQVVASDDPLAVGMPSTYAGQNATVSFNSPDGTVVVQGANRYPVVINKRIGLGHVVMIGHDYYETNTYQNRLVGNAVFNLPEIRDSLLITPVSDIDYRERVGGPFVNPHHSFTLRNTGSASLDWQMSGDPNWLSLTGHSGTLAAGQSTTIQVSLAPQALTLPSGPHSCTLHFDNLTSGMQQSRDIHLFLEEVAVIPFSDDFESDLGHYWSITGTNNYRIRRSNLYGPHDGSYHILMDSISGYSRNELTLNVNLLNYENVQLAFWVKGFDEYQGPPASPFLNGADFDGVAISVDGINWYTAHTFSSVNSQYARVVIDLDSVMDSFGLDYPSVFKIRFNQYDNEPLTNDGIMIDDIEITGNVKDDLTITPQVDMQTSGNESGPFVPDVFNYTLRNTGSGPLEWQLDPNLPWLLAVPDHGFLLSGESVAVEFRIISPAESLRPGVYTNDVVLRNLTSGYTRTSLCTLHVEMVPVELNIIDSIDPENDLRMPYGDVITGLTRTEQIILRNPSNRYSALVQDIMLVGSLFEGFEDTFPASSLNRVLWPDITGEPQINQAGINEPSAPYSLNLNGYPSGGDSVCTAVIDLTGLSNIELDYYYQQTGGGETPDPGDDLIFEFWSGTSWIQLDRQYGSGAPMSTFQHVVRPLPISAYHNQFKLRIRNIGSSGNFDDWFVDNVKLQSADGTSSPRLPLLHFCMEPDETQDIRFFRLENIPSLPFYIEPAGEVILPITFMPEKELDHEAFIQVRSSDPNQAEKTIELTGRGIPDYLTIIPDKEIIFEGHPGGPYMPTYHRFELVNHGPISIDWEIADPNWVHANPANGTLLPGKSVQVEFSASENANLLPKGIHTEILRFHNITTGKIQTRLAKFNLSTKPKIWYDPKTIESRISYRESDQQFITLRNTGDAPLQFNINAQYSSVNPAQATGELLQMTEESSLLPDKQVLPMADQMPYVPQEVIVRFGYMPNGEFLSTAQQEQVLSVISGATIIETFALVPGLARIQLPQGMSVQDAIVTLNQSDLILYVEPNYEFNVQDIIPNDAAWSQLWGMRSIGMPKAWEATTGNSNIVVAVIDTGVDYNHPDLQKNMWVNLTEQNGTAGVDDDRNGYIDDIYGYNFAYNNGNPMDDHYHGTHCAGTIGAVGNNGIGVVGVCWDVKIMAVKFLDSSGSGSTTTAIQCVQYATQMNANIMSNSWGGGAYSQALKDAIQAAQTKGILFVAAAGNNGTNNDVSPHYPSSYDLDNVIAVMATDPSDNRSVWPSGNSSCYGLTSVDIGAPGSDILSTDRGTGYRTLSGTSMATPHVSGAAALIWAKNPRMNANDVKNLLISTVDKTLPGLCVSEGRLSLANALQQTGTSWLTYGPVSGVIQPGQELSIEVVLDGSTTPGTYTAQLKILSNDSLCPEVLIPVSMEVENVAFSTEFFDVSDNDLDGVTLIFKPQDNGFYIGCSVPASQFPVDPTGGTPILLEDDDYEVIPLDDNTIPYFGQDYKRLFVGSNGYVTFTSGDYNNAESLENHFAIPRISALFDDLDPSSGGTVTWKKDSQKITITFDQVPEYNTTTPNSFQIELHYTGLIRITLLQISATDGLIGLSDGQGVSPFFVETDFSGYGMCSFPGDINKDLYVNLNDFAVLAQFWQAAYSEPITGPELFLDAFTNRSFDGNNGTDLFSGSWQEIGESDGPTYGYVQITPEHASNNRMQFNFSNWSSGFGVLRQLDLSGAESAVLSFEWTTGTESISKLEVEAAISTDGGTTWTNLTTITHSSQVVQLEQIDITPYISSQTQIRFAYNCKRNDTGNFYIDNVKIECQSPTIQPNWNASCDMNNDLIVDITDILMFCEYWLD